MAWDLQEWLFNAAKDTRGRGALGGIIYLAGEVPVIVDTLHGRLGAIALEAVSVGGEVFPPGERVWVRDTWRALWRSAFRSPDRPAIVQMEEIRELVPFGLSAFPGSGELNQPVAHRGSLEVPSDDLRSLPEIVALTGLVVSVHGQIREGAIPIPSV